MSRNRAAKAQQRRAQPAQPQQENTIRFEQAKPIKYKPINLVPRTRNQEKLILALNSPDEHIVVATGPAGTGKTYIAMVAAVKALRDGDCERIVLTRPAVEVEGERHGFLPGDLNAKMEPWTMPLFDILREYYRQVDIDRMLADKIIDITPLAFMRGRTLKNAWIIADEMQNATPGQCKMLMTRIGEDSKIVITGDVEQTDRKGSSNGLVDLLARLEGRRVEGMSVCKFGIQDVQRHPIIGQVLKLYAD